MKKSETQQWLQEIYKRPELYEGKVVAILNDAQIIEVAEGFKEAKRKVHERHVSSAEKAPENVTFFLVPRHVTRLRIPTLRIRHSERQLVFKPVKGQDSEGHPIR